MDHPALITFVPTGAVYLAAFVLFFRGLYPVLRAHFTGQSKWEVQARLP